MFTDLQLSSGVCQNTKEKNITVRRVVQSSPFKLSTGSWTVLDLERMKVPGGLNERFLLVLDSLVENG